MKIVEFYAENIKRLKAVSIKPDGAMVLITGRNGQGKSSVLDAIFMALGGKEAIPGRPVRDGEEKAFVKLNLGEITVTRRFTAEGGTGLVVEAANGAKFSSPQKMLDDLIGELTFDPLEFSRMKPADQFESLRAILGMEEALVALDTRYQVAYTARTNANGLVKASQGRVNAVVVPPNAPTAPVDVVHLTVKIAESGRFNNDLDAAKRKIHELSDKVKATREASRKLLDEANVMENEQWELQSKWRGMTSVNLDAEYATLERAQSTNEQFAIRKRRTEAESDLAAHVKIADNCQATIDNILQEKQDLLATAAVPVDGLTLGNGEVLLNGLPLNQASSAEQIKVSVAIAMAANPKLRILHIKDGSLLDADNLEVVRFLADLNDYQVWVERVSDAGNIGIVIEDGEVK